MNHKQINHDSIGCQWPFGDPQEKDFHFCGRKSAMHKPYCREHCEVAYISEEDTKLRLKAWKLKGKREVF